MGGGVIHALKGKEVLKPIFNVKVKINDDFPHLTLADAIDEAKRFAIGAVKKKVNQQTRGFTCSIIVRDVDIGYKI